MRRIRFAFALGLIAFTATTAQADIVKPLLDPDLMPRDCDMDYVAYMPEPALGAYQE